MILGQHATFKEDHIYTAVANVSHKLYRYFPYDMTTFEFNGCTDEVIKKTTYSDGYVATYQIYHTFPPLTPDPTTVNELEISLPEPAPGAKPDYSAVVPEGKGYAVDNEGGVMWFNVTDDDEYIDPNSDYVFEPNKEYRVMITLVTTNDDYKFAATNRRAELNGMELGFSDYGWNEEHMAYVESHFVCAPEGGTAIRDVNVEINEPAVGDYPLYYALTDSKLYNVSDAEDDDSLYISGGVSWFNETDNKEMAYNDTFEEGKSYELSVRLTSSGYSFAPADEINATFNGKPALAKRLSDRSILVRTYYDMAAQPVAKDISSCTVSGIKAKTYNGKTQTQSVTVKDGSNTLKSGTDYTVSYKNNKNAGTATLTITGKGDYEGTIKKTFKINKAANPMTLGYKKSATAKAKAKTTIKKAVVVSKAQGSVTYKTNNKKVTVKSGTMTVAKGLKKGKTYKVKITVTAKGNNNYKSQKVVKTIKIKVK